MANELDTLFTNIATAIRNKNGQTTTYKPNQMADAINAIPTSSTINLQTKTVTPSESSQTASPDAGYDGLSSVTVNAISSSYIGSQIARKSSSDLTSSGKTVTVPAGYYAEQSSKDVTTATQATPTVSINKTTGVVTGSATQTAGYVEAGTKSGTLNLTTAAGATITPTESSQVAVAADRYTLGAINVAAISSTYVGSEITQRDSSDLSASGATVTVPSGYYAAQATKAISNGSATAPASISGNTATLSTGTNTLTLTKTVSVTPVVSAGYVSSGTAGNSSVSLTASVATKAASTITPGTSNQTIASGTYLTGTQTIAGDADLVAANIKTGVQIFNVTGNYTSDATAVATDIVSGETAYVNGSKVTGSLVINKYYTGTTTPSSSLGNNGDIYLQS